MTDEKKKNDAATKAAPAPRNTVSPGGPVNDELASLNAEVREKGAQANSDLVEASIEEKAKQRRVSEKPAAAGFKKS